MRAVVNVSPHLLLLRLFSLERLLLLVEGSAQLLQRLLLYFDVLDLEVILKKRGNLHLILGLLFLSGLKLVGQLGNLTAKFTFLLLGRRCSLFLLCLQVFEALLRLA